MNHADLKQYYLEIMEIDQWIVREKKSINAEDPLIRLARDVAQCIRCPLHQSRTNTVFSRGNPQAKFMIIGEAPGFYEDKQGLPFVGKAGALLNQMLFSIGFDESMVYIANVIKCRPPNNRDPHQEEVNQCKHYLNSQIELIKPQVILGLGRFAAHFLINKALPMRQAREKIYDYQGIPCMITYHPAYLLRNPKDKKKAYTDLLRIQRFLETLKS